MKGLVAFLAALVACWLAIGGLVALFLGWGAVEVLAVEGAGLVLGVLSAGLLIADSAPGCGHQLDCSDTWGGP